MICSRFWRFTACPLAVCLSLAAAWPAMAGVPVAAPAWAHLYTFNDGTVSDTATNDPFYDGTLVDPSGIAFYSGGQVRLTNNNGANSNQDFSNPATVGAYVDLPNFLISDAAFFGTSGELSLEFFATVQEQRDWARLGDFGVSDAGEDMSTGGAGSEYLIVVPRTGGRPTPEETNKFSASTHSLSGEENFLPDPAGDLPLGVEHHVVVTYDQNDTSLGTNGLFSLYLNGDLIGSRAIEDQSATPIDISNMNDVNNWLGRAQWGDALFDGSYNQFAVYDYELTSDQVMASFARGAEVGGIAVPTLMVDRETGVVTVMNNDFELVTVDEFTITSPAGAINAVGVTAVDTDFTVTADDGMIDQTTTGNGVSINSGSGASIGTAWNRSPFEDLTFSYELANGFTSVGEVVFVGEVDPIQAADLDADGDVDEDDFYQYAAGVHTDLAEMTAYERYLAGDIDSDGDNDYEDFRLMKAAFIAANGQAAFANLSLGSVPEPGAALLLACCLSTLALRRR